MKILGISAFYHDSAAVLIDEGRIIAAAQEERFSRKRFDADFPEKAISWCLESAGCSMRDVDLIAFHEKPFLKFTRIIQTYAAFAPHGFWSFRSAMPQWLGSKLYQKRTLRRRLEALDPGCDLSGKLLFAEHHQSHAASAFYPSPFESAVVLTMDGVGEWATTSVCIGNGADLTPKLELMFPHSLGLLYTAVTQYLGFKVLSGEYKVMGLAPYGTPKYCALFLEHLVDLKTDGTFRLDQRYFDYCTGGNMISPAFAELFGHPIRSEENSPLEQFHMDMAASLQWVTEEIVIRLCRDLTSRFGIRNLCLAGGVALNCVANGRVRRELDIDGLWVQPAAGDAGCALGAALAAWHQHLKQPRPEPAGRDAMQGSYLGPEFSPDEIKARLEAAGAHFEDYAEDTVMEMAVKALAAGKVVGWFQGRMEFGPRALGARSILADARSPEMQKTLNLKVKNRESFRPFAPAVTQEDAADWFELQGDSPYMLLTAPVLASRRKSQAESDFAGSYLDRLNRVRSEIPAVTHMDYSARVQTVNAETNPRFHRLLTAFRDKTDCPVLINTSFNVRGEPIVCTPEDAFRCFMGTDIDMLIVGDCVLEKDMQKPDLMIDYKSHLTPD